MALEFCLPAIAEADAEGFLVNWFKDEGQSVKAGDLLLEVQFEKVNTEVTAPHDGVVTKILVPQGMAVKVGQPLCLIAAGMDEVEANVAEGPLAAGPAEAPAPRREVLATPSARRLARELGVDLSAVPGTGPGGRIGEEDVKRHAAAGRREPLSPAQRITGERMLQSLRESAQFTLGREVEVTALVRRREALKQAGSPVSLTDLLHRAIVLALAAHPRLQAQLEGGDLVYPAAVHLGFAVARGDDLLVPVIRDASSRHLPDLAGERIRLTEAVQQGRVNPLDLQGATFTVSNLGALGIDFFTPVLNPPQPAILGVGRTVERGSVQSLMLSLTVDHRVINGATGAAFLATLARLLEEPKGWATE